MKVSYNWLKEFVGIDIPPVELAQKLTSAGPEITGIRNVGINSDNRENILLCRISDIELHPRDDGLSIVTVNVGKNSYRLITNSKTLKKGSYAVIAFPGTKLPNGLVISEAHIKGEKSQGMMLAKEHLNLEEKSQDVWNLGKDEKKAKNLFEIYTEEDYIFEVELTSNRSDCLSIIGMAREIAAITDKELVIPAPPVFETSDEVPDVTIDDRTLCSRYSARILRGIKVIESPEWLKKKLELCGIRAINNIVDATNYVLMEMGHPMHAFDLSRLSGSCIIVRRAEKSEMITTLDGQHYNLDEKMLLIADGSKAVALAGIMGGENSQVYPYTTDILLESAYFDPVSIRQTSKKLGLRTEASYRFERTADWGITVSAIERATEIILLTCTPVISKIRDEYVNIIKDKIINVKADYVSKKIGIKLSLRNIEAILKKLKFTILAKREDNLEIKVPTFRSDISRVIDIVEEVARIYGYDNIPQNMFKPPIDLEGLVQKWDEEDFLREILRGQGFTEAFTMSFTNENELNLFKADGDNLLKLQNPLSSDATVMRNYLFPGLLKVIEYNVKSAYINEARFYEIGRSFNKKKSAFIETKKAAFALFGEKCDFYTASGLMEYILLKTGLRKIEFNHIILPFLHPVNSAEISVEGKNIGFIGEVHPDIIEKLELRSRIYICELETGLLKEYLNRELVLSEIGKFPPNGRDISLVVNMDIPSRSLMTEIGNFHEWIQDVKFIDLFKGSQIGENKKSVTFSITFQSREGTLDDDEVNYVMEELSTSLKEKYGAQLRE